MMTVQGSNPVFFSVLSVVGQSARSLTLPLRTSADTLGRATLSTHGPTVSTALADDSAKPDLRLRHLTQSDLTRI